MKNKAILISIISMIFIVVIIITLGFINYKSYKSKEHITLYSDYSDELINTPKIIIKPAKKIIKLFIGKNTNEDLSDYRIKLFVYDKDVNTLFSKAIPFDDEFITENGYIEIEYTGDLLKADKYLVEIDAKALF